MDSAERAALPAIGLADDKAIRELSVDSGLTIEEVTDIVRLEGPDRFMITSAIRRRVTRKLLAAYEEAARIRSKLWSSA